MSEENLTDQEQQRRLKLENLREAGIDPYPARAHRTHTTAQAIAALEEAAEDAAPVEVAVVGRLVSIRVMGKSSFAHIEDNSGRIQLYLRRDLLGDDLYAMFRQNLDLGDFVEATGTMFLTRTGEPSVRVEQLRLLSKALRPLPVVKEKDGQVFDAFSDKEQRYRQRYVDLAVNPEVRDIFGPGPGSCPLSAASWMGRGSSRSRPRCCSRSMEGPLPGHLPPFTTSSSKSCTCASRTSCT